MHEITDYLNMGGIILEIVGFCILLTKFRDRIRRKYGETFDKIAEGKSIDERARTGFLDDDVNKMWNKIESIGIPLVIIGLICQGLSTWYDV